MSSTSASFDQYMRDHKIEHLFNSITKELVKEKPENPYDFMISKIKTFQANPTDQQFRKIVFVLGGPGSGKGTQCAKLVAEYGMVHFSAGDLLREEVKSQSERGRMIDKMIKDGAIVPGHITIELLQKAIMSYPNGEDKYFLIDGFPREMKQALDFEREINACQFVLFFECPLEVLEARILERGKTSARVDDNIESLKKRFITYQKQTMPVIEYFTALNKVKHIDSSKPIEDVFANIKSVFDANEKQLH